VGQGNAKDLAAKEADVIYDECGKAGLIDDVCPSVDGCSAGDFGPDDEDQSDIVNPAIHAVQEVVSKLRTVWKAHEEGNYRQHGNDNRA
jgi:hypothetical protein